MKKIVKLAIAFIFLVLVGFIILILLPSRPGVARTPIDDMVIGILTVREKASGSRFDGDPVSFPKGYVLTSYGVDVKAGSNKGSVSFCGNIHAPECAEEYVFPGDKFNITTSNSGAEVLKVLQKSNGRVTVYNDNGTYWIGFKEA